MAKFDENTNTNVANKFKQLNTTMKPYLAKTVLPSCSVYIATFITFQIQQTGPVVAWASFEKSHLVFKATVIKGTV